MEWVSSYLESIEVSFASHFKLTYKDSSGSPRCELILEIASVGLPWSFDADGKLFRLVSEACRIRMAYLFDPLHQITAVYAEMLTSQPLRFLLADDPGAGKTIMAGLLIKAHVW
jgi:hypothetical protein